MGISKNVLARMKSLAKRGDDSLSALSLQASPQIKILSIGDEGSDARKVLCAVVDSLGTPLKGVRIGHVKVIVDATPSTALAGSDEFTAVISGGATAEMIISTNAAGQLGFTVTDEAVESIVIKIEIDGCPPVIKSLAFAA